MSFDLEYRIIFLLLIVINLFVTGYYRRKADLAGGKVSRKDEGFIMLNILRVFGLLIWLSIMVYPLFPPILNWAEIIIDDELRLLGIILGLFVTPMLFWTLKTIGNNITQTIITREKHKLVTTGPYKYIRHPLYTFGSLLFLSLSIISGNWFILVIAALAFGTISLRTGKEEMNLLERFGEEYEVYIRKTGRYLPRLNHAKDRKK
jgi:protein-S-isoprenylcysteine O-methyltransferase Ste14